MKNFIINVTMFIFGMLVIVIFCTWKAYHRPPPLIQIITKQVPEVRTVYIYKDKKQGDVLAAARIPKGSITAILDQTGHTNLIYEPDTLKWFSKETAFHGSLYAGFRGSTFTYRGTLERSFAQIKHVQLAWTISADKDSQRAVFFAGVGGRF